MTTTQQDELVLMSESLKDRLDTKKIYNDSKLDDLVVSFWVDSTPVCLSVHKIKIAKKRMTVLFECDSSISSKILISRSNIGSFSISTKNEDIIKVDNLKDMISVSFQITGSGLYLCELVVNL